MLEVVTRAIEQFYIKKDYQAFKQQCGKPLHLPIELKEYIHAKGLKLIEGEDTVCTSKAWKACFDTYKNGEFEVTHTTMLQISKVAPLFFMRNDFVIPSRDPDTLEPELKGWDCQACTIEQYDLLEEMRNVLQVQGYHEVFYRDLIEVAPGFDIPEGKEKLGRNVTVEHLLFMDIFDILKGS